VEVSYRSPYPVLCADIVNTLAEEFIAFSIAKRYETTQQASDFLSEEIDNLREDLAAKERELQRYGREKKLFFLSNEESATISKFADLTGAYTKSQIERIKAEASYRELKELDVDSQPQFVRNPMIQDLKTEYTRMRNEYREKGEIYKSDYPVMVTLRAKLDSMRSELENEITKAVDEAERAYRSAQKEEASLKNLLEAHKADVIRMNSNAILYNSIKIEVENKRNLLNSLVARQNETLVSARLSGLKTSNISIIDRAEVPKSPVSPNKRRNIFLAIIVGLFGGVGLCFFLEYLDNTVKGPEEVEKMTGLPSLGVIPYLPPEGMKKKKRYGYYSKYKYKYSYSEKKDNPGNEQELPDIKEIELVNHLHPKFFISEDYRTVRTSILLSHAEIPPKAIAFSSALPREGKTATAVNIAVAFSQLEKKVLLVDSDMRKPRLHRIFKVRNVGGLSGYLTGKVSIEDAVQKTNVKNIWLIPSGPIPPNPAELLNSGKMKGLIEKLKKRFDIVLLDTPPVLAVVDAVITSSFIDSTVFVIQAGKTTRKPFLQAVEELKKAKGKIIGVLFNEVKARGEGYYSPYYRYSRYRYQYHDEKEESKTH
jgi:capsular exopolysaccharide synthesis family protein